MSLVFGLDDESIAGQHKLQIDGVTVLNFTINGNFFSLVALDLGRLNNILNKLFRLFVEYFETFIVLFEFHFSVVLVPLILHDNVYQYSRFHLSVQEAV